MCFHTVRAICLSDDLERCGQDSFYQNDFKTVMRALLRAQVIAALMKGLLALAAVAFRMGTDAGTGWL